MNGSSSLSGTPANARRTGKPSPSNPLGAVVSRRTGRKLVAAGSSRGRRGRTRTASTVMAGMAVLLSGGCRCRGPQARAEAFEDAGEAVEVGLVEVVDEGLSDR